MLLHVCGGGWLASPAHSATINEIRVVGNDRVEKETILFEIPYKKGAELNENTENDIIRALNKTGYFKNITVSFKNGVLTITVEENPIINKIAYEGMRRSMRDVLKEVVKLKSRQIFSDAVIQEVQQNILDLYRSMGFLGAKVTPKIVRLPNNAVDVVFEITEGDAAYVRKIFIIGNNSFERAELMDVFSIREKKWFHLKLLGGTANKLYDAEKFSEDQKNLVLFYLNRGYADFEIISAVAELDVDKKAFYITYNIKEGDVYKINDVRVDSKMKGLQNEILEKVIIIKKGMVFSNQLLEINCNFIKAVAKTAGYNFIYVEPVIRRNGGNKTVDIKFVVTEAPKIFVGRVDVKGNITTRDFVIRREVKVNEGDPFDHHCLKNIERSVQALGFFKTVKANVDQGDSQSFVNITVDVEEKQSGELGASFCYNYLEKWNVGLHLYNPNFLGRGQTAGFDWSLEKKERNFSIDFDTPYFMGRQMSFNASLFSSKSRKFSGLKRTQSGGLVGIRYRLRPRLFQAWSYKLHREELAEDSKRGQNSVLKNKQVLSKTGQAFLNWLETDDGKEYKKLIDSENDIGVKWGSAVIHTIAYDCTNRRIFPSRGFKLSWTSKLSGLGGEIKYWLNSVSGSVHRSITKQMILTVRTTFSYTRGIWGEKLRVVDALFLGGDSMRGFDFFGISPVRGIPKGRLTEAFASFIGTSKPFLSETQLQFLERERDNILSAILGEDSPLRSDYAKLLNWNLIYNRSLLEAQGDAMKMLTIQKMRGRKVGGTLAWASSVDISFPIPFLPQEAELFGTVFADFGSVWRTACRDDGILYNDMNMRVSTGVCIAWNSFVGMLNIGYAWPLRSCKHDGIQRFLFGYGMKFS
ncbi:MAG: outer membrane protein assembly factor BamA [Holosporales bacterium]|nr:outer membrane protein assembly factor BamA [Holosporales bacterium]